MKIISIIAAALLAVNILLVIAMNRNKGIALEYQFLYFDSMTELNQVKMTVNNYGNRQIEEISLNMKKVDSKLYNIKQKEIDYRSVFAFTKIVFCYNPSYCKDCLKKYLSKIYYMTSNYEIDCVILINSEESEFTSPQINTYDLPMYYISQASLQTNDMRPFFFSMESDMKIKNAYVPDLGDINFVETYLKLNADVY